MAIRVEDGIALYRAMFLIRRFEETVAEWVRAGLVPGFVHLAIGQEGAAVGVVHALDGRDVVFSGHRAHGHLLARGADPARVLAEILGRAEGVCRGLGGSMHLVDTAVGFWGATGVVGGTIPLALGAAWARQATGGVVAVFFGDGASTTGIFHESLNLASLWRLPVLFCCENNGYAEFTARAEQSPVAYARRFAEVYGIPSAGVDGSDVEAVFEAARAAVAEVRAGGPYFLEVEVARLSGHYEGDPQGYRSAEEQARQWARDPVRRWRDALAERGVAEEALAAVEEEVARQVEAAREQAQKAPWPDLTVLNHG
ncbi:MAG: thiamine pyrophosphate-dependent dehydrogenase E1 component subunit alpha [Firmicutes bacterium]|nr:thiamine pyrophosphate-dependent dehydrogenase E1 component subunit alpha [Alicyclobacillaceae bacterium]MCL6496526.1 thiamine pyrophosphate-dependent dehydrogenase E1 component subunit alpha [Bacillota bacterium]